MHGPHSQEGSWLGFISHRVQFKNTQLFRGALSPNDALQKIIRVRNTHATVHLACISTKGNFKKSKAKQYIEVFFVELLDLPEVRELPEVVLADPSKTTRSFVLVLSCLCTQWWGKKNCVSDGFLVTRDM